MSEDETLAESDAISPEPVEEPTPEPSPPAEQTPAAPLRWFRVEFVAPANMRTPIEAAGRWWGERSVHILQESCAREVAAQPHFTLLNEVPEPPNAQPCTGCGKTPTP